ncbi:hypothetical protein ACTHOQ_13875 [Solibacillus silvestris]|uniref:hypothetical protein n=1 Tax=Solibacillus silvestris TaxID=76853 RepID=UPI003F7E6847
MPENEGSVSMFETVKNHEERITILEQNDRDHQLKLDILSGQMADLKLQNTELENTVLKDNRETRSTLVGQMEKLFELTQSAMGYQSSRSSQQHEFKMMKWNTMATVLFKICGAISVLGASGGGIYLVIQHFLTK